MKAAFSCSELGPVPLSSGNVLAGVSGAAKLEVEKQTTPRSRCKATMEFFCKDHLLKIEFNYRIMSSSCQGKTGITSSHARKKELEFCTFGVVQHASPPMRKGGL